MPQTFAWRATVGKQSVKRRPKPWTLARVRAECHSAPVVWLALCDMRAERGTQLLTPTRKLLSERTGITRHNTISQALTVLTSAGWIDLTHVPSSQNGNRTTLLRLILRRMQQKTVHTGGSSVCNENRCNSKQRKSLPDSYYVRGGGTKKPSPPSRWSGPPAGRPDTPPINRHPEKEHPAEKIERERMAEIRKRRETTERTKQKAREPPGAMTSVA